MNNAVIKEDETLGKSEYRHQQNRKEYVLGGFNKSFMCALDE